MTSNYEQKEITVGEKTYTLQKVPVRTALKMRMDWTLPDGRYNDIVMYEQILKYVVVNPKVTIDDFNNILELDELVTRATAFMFYEETEAEASIDEVKN